MRRTKNVEASRFSFQQTSADQALATADAYFDLMAAQDSLALTRQSLDDAAAAARQHDQARRRRRRRQRRCRARARPDGGGGVRRRDRATRRGVGAGEAGRRHGPAVRRGDDARGVRRVPGQRRSTSTSTRCPERRWRGGPTSRPSRRSATRAGSCSPPPGPTRASRFDLRFSGGVAQAYFGPTFHSLLRRERRARDQRLCTSSTTTRSGSGGRFKSGGSRSASVTGTFELPFGNNQRLGRFAQAAGLGASRARSGWRTSAGRLQNTVPKLADAVAAAPRRMGAAPGRGHPVRDDLGHRAAAPRRGRYDAHRHPAHRAAAHAGAPRSWCRPSVITRRRSRASGVRPARSWTFPTGRGRQPRRHRRGPSSASAAGDGR